jgi:general secretion pathway protein F
MTVEDPIEYDLNGVGQTQVNPRIDMTFAKALRAILRQDPDVIMIGEIRDLETAQIAVQASLTGHLVLATLHTNDAAAAVTRLLDMGIEPFLLSSTAAGRDGAAPGAQAVRHCKTFDGHWHAVGCEHCGHTGYQGRVGVYELLETTEQIRAQIHNRASEAEVRAAAHRQRHADHARRRRALAGGRRDHAGRTAARDQGLGEPRCPHSAMKPSTPAAPPSKGVLNADSARAARADLRTQGLVPLKVDAIAAQVDAAASPRAAASASACRHRAGAVHAPAGQPAGSRPAAGAGLYRLAGTGRASLHARPDRLDPLRGDGRRLAVRRAGRHPRDFAEIYRALVASGEQIGQLSRVLSRLADYIERRNALVQKVRLAFTYPAIVTVVAFAIVIFLLTYVVPQIVSVFANTKQKLPVLTIIMLAVSDFVRNYGIVVAIALVGAWFMWRRALQNPALKRRWHTWLLTAPLYGKFERSLNTARFASTLAITTGSGVPILRALETSRDTLSNVAMQELVEEATASVREGVSLARALSAQKHFPPMLIHMIRAGEITGELPAMLDRAAAAQESDLERRTLTIAGLLEPALILAMGVVVLLIVLAVLMPIIEINQLVR